MAASPDWQPVLREKLDSLAGALDERDLSWASGYLAGLAAARAAPRAATAPAPVAETRNSETLHVWYGSQTGNARGVAERLAAAAREQGVTVNLASLADVAPRQIGKIRRLALVVSTHGDGDPPDDAEALRDYLSADNAPRLAGLRYAVFALGDSSYPHFCKTGHDFDAALQGLGAERLLELHAADVDFVTAENAWRPVVVERAGERPKTAGTSIDPRRLQLVSPEQGSYNRQRPFAATRLSSTPLTVAPSAKTVHHVAVSLEDSGLAYQPGDSLGVWPENPAASVAEVLALAKLSAEQAVTIGDETYVAADWLRRELELTRLSKPFLEQYAQAGGHRELTDIVNDATRLRAFVEQRQVADVLLQFPARLPAERLFGMLRRIAPRLYSIASSPLADPGEAHLTVRTVGGARDDGVLRAGAASWHLNHDEKADNGVRVFVEANPRFHLPAADAPLVMVGAGTGVAPFRAFVEHRRQRGDSGENWLFFGEQRRRTDFLYQLEWQRHLKSGALRRLDVAFSRDRAERHYVQHRLLERGRDLYDWLERGACLYVCGATAMAADVEESLLQIVGAQRGADVEQAREYVRALKQQNRYRKDVY